VLAEAQKIEHKHLFTLETAISKNQTKEMQAHQLQLVVPKHLHSTYAPEQAADLLDLAAFTDLVKRRQRAA
jgi:hypothetical protein